jgi:hypothetical protein
LSRFAVVIDGSSWLCDQEGANMTEQEQKDEQIVEDASWGGPRSGAGRPDAQREQLRPRVRIDTRIKLEQIRSRNSSIHQATARFLDEAMARWDGGLSERQAEEALRTGIAEIEAAISGHTQADEIEELIVRAALQKLFLECRRDARKGNRGRKGS